MEEVKVFVETSWKGPARQDGVAAWLVECMRHGAPVTRQGFVHLESGTEAQATLMALANAFCMLKKPCRVQARVGCRHVLAALCGGWHLQWQENGWVNAKGEPVGNAGLWKVFLEKAAPHEYAAGSGRHEYTSVMHDAVMRELRDWKRRKGNGGKA